MIGMLLNGTEAERLWRVDLCRDDVGDDVDEEGEDADEQSDDEGVEGVESPDIHCRRQCAIWRESAEDIVWP